MKGIALLTSLEEKFDILFENFIELEIDTVSHAIRDMYQSKGTYSDFHEIRVSLSRRVINLLTSGRLYIDQTAGDLKRAKKLGLTVSVDSLLSSAKAKSFDFRFVEALRNIAQHRALPIDGVTLGGKWIGEDGKAWRPPADIRYNRHWLDFYLKPETMSSDTRLDPTLRSEIASMGQSISIMPVLRRYIDCIGCIHEEVRKQTDDKLSHWSEVIADCISSYEGESKNNRALGLHAIRLDGSGAICEKVAVFDDIKKHLDRFRSKNRNLSNVSSRFVSTHENAF